MSLVLQGRASQVRLLRALVVAAAIGGSGCKSMSLQDLPWPSQLSWLKNFLADREEVSYYPTARENFRRGMENYNKEEWQDASKYFDYVRTKFPHSRYAVIAELRLADSHFGKEKWLDSIDAYRAFIRLHPTHEAVGYATFQIAKAYYRQIPEEWFFLPSVSERDQAAAQDAVRAFDDFLIRFPDHERAEESRKLRKDARSRLANHEWYAADYYRRDHPKGSAFRYERIADLYPDVDYADDGLLRAGEIWEKEGDLRRARLDYERVARDYPKSPLAKRAAAAAKRLGDILAAQDKADLDKRKREEEARRKKEDEEAARAGQDNGPPGMDAPPASDDPAATDEGTDAPAGDTPSDEAGSDEAGSDEGPADTPL
jgi:outer membrane protein assembly factor BamD